MQKVEKKWIILYNKHSDLKYGGESMEKIMQISFKIILIMFIFIILFCTFSNNYIYALDVDKYKPTQSSGDNKLKDIGNRIIGPIQIIGSLVSVIAIICIGIKYMLGSVEEKAQYKETMKPYIIGAAMVFGITNILSIVYEFASQI